MSTMVYTFFRVPGFGISTVNVTTNPHHLDASLSGVYAFCHLVACAPICFDVAQKPVFIKGIFELQNRSPSIRYLAQAQNCVPMIK